MPDELRPGAALVRIRWDKATAEERAEQGRLMAEARWTKYRSEENVTKGNTGKGIGPRRKLNRRKK